ncbi:MAG: hypothetical protein ACXW1Y_12340 [Acidimicrobiia bacterium]
MRAVIRHPYFGADRSPDMMTEIMARYTRNLTRHTADWIIED